MRLIDADDALAEIKNIMEVVKRDANDDEYYLGLRRGALIIDQTRTIDAVEVVRCKDCKHWIGELIDTSIGIRFCEGWELSTIENEYCSFGEKK